MAHEALEIGRPRASVHPENRPMPEPEAPATEPEPLIARPSLTRVLVFAFLSGTIGSVLTLMCLAPAFAGGDYRAALSVWPMVLTLIAIVNGWFAVNVFLGSGLHK